MKILIADTIFTGSVAERSIPVHYMENWDAKFPGSVKYPSPRTIALGNAFLKSGWEVAYTTKQDIVRSAKQIKPDLVFFTMNLKLEVLRRLNDTSLTWFWFRDTYHMGWEKRIAKMRRTLDTVKVSTFTSATAARTCENLRRTTRKRVWHFLEPVDTEHFSPDNVPKETNHGVMFIGRETKYRKRFFDIIRQSGYSFIGYGKNYSDKKPDRLLYYKDFPYKLDARIYLNLARGRKWGATTPSTRIPWILSCGGFVLSEDGDLEPFRSGEHIGTFKGEADLIGVVDDRIAKEYETGAIAINGMEYVRENWSAGAVARKMIEVIG